MELSYWLVAIAGMGFLICLFLYIQARERSAALARLYERTLTEKTQLAELLSLAQRELGGHEARTEVLTKAEENLKLQFRDTANELFQQVSDRLTTQSEKKIGDILLPLQQRLSDFQKKVDDAFGAHGKEQHSLKNEIGRIVNMNEQMRMQAESLTKALRGDVKAQGNWGEVMLERILEESGLIKGVDYTIQASDMGLKGAEGNRLRPDVIVNLPDNKHVLIDAKVSLTAYERFCREQDVAQQEAHLKDFIRSIKNHITGLEGKRYQDIAQLSTPDFVFMFLPVEGAFSLALQYDQELHSFAWGRKIVLVCPSTLFASLMTIASLWRIERQNKNAEEIARQAGAIYDKFVGFVDDLQEIGERISRTQNAYEGALNKLSSGRGNVIGGIEKLKTLGAKTTKSLPRDLLEQPQPEEV